jgi:hypothetical protein
MATAEPHEMQRTNWMGATAFIFGVSFAFFISGRSPVKKAEIEGHLYRECEGGRTLSGPIGGAVVSTSLDSVTAMTDRDGHFRLVTNTRVPDDQTYTATVRSGDVVVSQQLGGSGIIGADIILSAPNFFYYCGARP